MVLLEKAKELIRTKLGRRAWRWISAAAIAWALVGGARLFLIDAFRIPTSSMEGTLLAGDFLLVNKAVYGARLPGSDLRILRRAGPKRGDVVVFHPPHQPEKHYVKRVVGVPGDTLAMRKGYLYLNGRILQESYTSRDWKRKDGHHPDMAWQATHLVELRTRQPTRDDWGPLLIPAQRFFVLGDNRDNSEDSRYWGFVEGDQILGQPWFVYYSRIPSGSTQTWTQRVRWDRIGDLVE